MAQFKVSTLSLFTLSQVRGKFASDTLDREHPSCAWLTFLMARCLPHHSMELTQPQKPELQNSPTTPEASFFLSQHFRQVGRVSHLGQERGHDLRPDFCPPSVRAKSCNCCQPGLTRDLIFSPITLSHLSIYYAFNSFCLFCLSLLYQNMSSIGPAFDCIVH